MSTEFDYDLTSHQWDALRSLRLPASRRGNVNRFVIDGLITLALATMMDDRVVLTEKGRKVLVRGSSSCLLDLAA
jgi:ABC-type hemin transport system ATPase subunit